MIFANLHYGSQSSGISNSFLHIILTDKGKLRTNVSEPQNHFWKELTKAIHSVIHVRFISLQGGHRVRVRDQSAILRVRLLIRYAEETRRNAGLAEWYIGIPLFRECKLWVLHFDCGVLRSHLVKFSSHTIDHRHCFRIKDCDRTRTCSNHVAVLCAKLALYNNFVAMSDAEPSDVHSISIGVSR